MPAVTIQSNKIVSNDGKRQLKATRASFSQPGEKKRKKKMNEWTFWPTQYFPGFKSQLTGGKKKKNELFWPTQYFSGFKLNKCSFVLLKGVKQWSSDMHLSSSISDSMRAGSGSFSGSSRDTRRWLTLHPLSGRPANHRDQHTLLEL